MPDFIQWIAKFHVGEFAGIIGLFVSIAGFAIAISQIRRVKSVSEQLQGSVGEVQRHLELKSVAIDLDELVRALEEIKQLHRQNLVHALPSTYASVRRKLIEVRNRYPILSSKQKAALQGTISRFSEFEKFLDSSQFARQPDVRSVNEAVNREIDKLIETLDVMQNGGRRNSERE